MNHTATPASDERLRTLPFNWREIRYRPRPYIIYTISILVFTLGLVALGWIEKLIFDRLTGGAPATAGLWWLLALMASIELARIAGHIISSLGYTAFWANIGTLVRRNVLGSLLRRPGALPPPVSPGEAVNRFDTDVNEVADFPL